MTAPSKLRAAQAAPDRAARVRRMADLMRHHQNGPEGACTYRHLYAAGFTEAEIEAYRDDARALLSNRAAIRLAPAPGRMEGRQLVRAAIAIRRRKEAAAGKSGRA